MISAEAAAYDAVMADYEFPPPLVELRCAHLRAEAKWAAATDEDERDSAYREVQDLVLALHRDPWLREAGGGHSVRAALLETAKAQFKD